MAGLVRWVGGIGGVDGFEMCWLDLHVQMACL